MITNQILQSTIDGLSSITKAELSVIDPDGKVLASNFKESISFASIVKSFATSPADSQEIQGYQFFKIHDELQLCYILVVSGVSEDSYIPDTDAPYRL